MEVFKKLRRVWRFMMFLLKLFGGCRTNLHVAERNAAAVFLKKNVAISPFSKVRNRVILAFGNKLAVLRRAALVLKKFFAVQPMFNVVAFDQDAGVVPLADVVHFFVFGGRNQIIKRTERAIALAAKFGIRMPFIIENLKLQADGRADRRLGACASDCAEIGLHKVFDAAVATGSRFEINNEFKI